MYSKLFAKEECKLRDSIVDKYNLNSCKRIYRRYRFYLQTSKCIYQLLCNCYYYMMFFLTGQITLSKLSFRFDMFLPNATVEIHNDHSEHLLADNYKLKHLQIKNSKVIPYGFCFNDIMLETVKIGKETETIKQYAFENCLSLKSVFIPKTIKTIESYAFLNCVSLSKVVFY